MITRPFNLEDAKAGAPVGYSDNSYCEIIKFDLSRKPPIIAMKGAHKMIMQHYEDGLNTLWHSGNLVMTPLGYCEGRPVFTGDVLISGGDEVTIGPQERKFDFMRWPDPLRKYPVTSMTDIELSAAFSPDGTGYGLLRYFANAAIKRAIDDGSVTIKE